MTTSAGFAIARHETFVPRQGWLKKGFDAVADDAHIFANEDAPLRLGVGKNMARSIKYWLLATDVVGAHGTTLKPTLFGQQLLSEDGYDPYLENPSSLWLLHWMLVKSPALATLWYYTFGVTPVAQFRPNELEESFMTWAQRAYPNARIARSSVKKDVSAISRMYVRDGRVGEADDEIRSPFTDLGLLRYGAGKSITFVLGKKPHLSREVIVYTLLDYLELKRSHSAVTPLNEFLVALGSPGMALRVGEAEMSEAVEVASKKIRGLSLSQAAGVLQVNIKRPLGALKEDVLALLYRA